MEFFDILKNLTNHIKKLELQEKIETINLVKKELHKISPFANEPVDCVTWVKAEMVKANDYNPNKVAPPEMKLLQHSVRSDGFTQPIVVYEEEQNKIVIDGFHRHRVGRECKDIKERLNGYLPVTEINTDREDRSDRIAATIRHNRARGKHTVDAMSEIIVELSKRNWSDQRIAKELGMESDEVLRLKQISGLAEMFADQEFSEAWEVCHI